MINPGPLLTRQFFKLCDPDFPIFEYCPDFQPATHGLNVVGKRTDTDVGTMRGISAKLS